MSGAVFVHTLKLNDGCTTESFDSPAEPNEARSCSSVGAVPCLVDAEAESAVEEVPGQAAGPWLLTCSGDFSSSSGTGRPTSSSILEIKGSGNGKGTEFNNKLDELHVNCASVIQSPSSRRIRNRNASLSDFIDEGSESMTFLSTPLEEPTSPEDLLKNYAKHFFILSDAGKPIYSRHGSEEELSSLMGIIQVLVSCVKDTDGATLRLMKSEKVQLAFLHEPPLILVASSKHKDEPSSHLAMQLDYMHKQIHSVLTKSQLTRIFEKRRNFDLRRLLARDAEKTFECLHHFTDSDYSAMLSAVRCLPLLTSVRDYISQSILQVASKIKNLVFVLLICGSQLISMAGLRNYPLHSQDLHLIINLIAANPSFKNSENWLPICLPRFDDSGFLYAHLSYVSETHPACILFLTTDRDSFAVVSEARAKLIARLCKGKNFLTLSEACSKATHGKQDLNLPSELSSDLRFFLYKNRTTHQYTCSEIGAPYWDQREKDRLFRRILKLHAKMHDKPSLKICYFFDDLETILGWLTGNFELYAVFTPLITRNSAILLIDKLIKWLKKEENNLFILNPPLF